MVACQGRTWRFLLVAAYGRTQRRVMWATIGILVISVALTVASRAGGASDVCNGLTATIVGTSGDDVLSGTSGVDVIVGLEGNDDISGLGGADVICGGDGDDTITGGGGPDVIFGDGGDDTITGGGNDDTIDGGAGIDEANFGGANPVTVDLAAGTATGQGNDTLVGIENLDGTAQADVLRGDAGPNVFLGQDE